MSGTLYGTVFTYGGTVCTGSIYGIEDYVNGSQGGNVSSVVEWVGVAVL